MQFCTKVVHGKSWRHRTRLVLHGGCKMTFSSTGSWCGNPYPICKKMVSWRSVNLITCYPWKLSRGVTRTKYICFTLFTENYSTEFDKAVACIVFQNNTLNSWPEKGTNWLMDTQTNESSAPGSCYIAISKPK